MNEEHFKAKAWFLVIDVVLNLFVFDLSKYWHRTIGDAVAIAFAFFGLDRHTPCALVELSAQDQDRRSLSALKPEPPLDTAYRLADSLCIWGTLMPTPSGAVARANWNPQAPWWAQTKAFLQTRGQNLATCRA